MNRAYPENTNFQTFGPRNLKFHAFGNFNTTKKCRKFSLALSSNQKYNQRTNGPVNAHLTSVSCFSIIFQI